MGIIVVKNESGVKHFAEVLDLLDVEVVLAAVLLQVLHSLDDAPVVRELVAHLLHHRFEKCLLLVRVLLRLQLHPLALHH